MAIRGVTSLAYIYIYIVDLYLALTCTDCDEPPLFPARMSKYMMYVYNTNPYVRSENLG